MEIEILKKLFEVIFPVFFIIGIGYLFGKKNPDFDSNVITPGYINYSRTMKY